ncbi:unnamed protein product [Spirodela intermedia]|uniref:BHLH domain-containing protein n=1 Tax=Spirodela intermedia TaxID=51605 RepID=A0A7I8J9W4_SPIIN|nr:unnamed protein product [Spirodela intermedia]CAA6666880.1 unnamed protein product [Spirodela intermedia]
MESALKAALRRLCSLHGWLYGVFLQASLGDPGLLAPVEIYHEERTPAGIIDALRRVHRVGQGTISKVVLSRGHHWISSDKSTDSCYFHEILELKLQFLAGIKTVAAVSLLPFGVVLFGSTLKVPESSDFVNQIRHSFRKLGNFSGLLHGGDQNSSIREGAQELPGGLSSLSESWEFCGGVSPEDWRRWQGPEEEARPGESTRPRPRDRQQIQDRVKELREIVPNGAKCSIDALLARTVNHMLFLQGVIKYADKIKQADEPKVIHFVVLTDHLKLTFFSSEKLDSILAGQTIVCPASIQEVNPLGQMLIEILCEDHGSFLEIADSIRGFGLTILKGVMEARNRRIWARFLVEANRNTNRMEIFLHLVQLLAKMSGSGGSKDGPGRVIDCGISGVGAYQQSLMAVPSGSADRAR